MGMLEATAARHPARTALVWRGERACWGDLAAAARARSERLAALGTRRGDVVALLLPNTPDFVASFFGAAALGAAVAPLNPGFTPAEVEAALRGCRLRALVAAAGAAPLASRLDVPLLASDGALPAGASPSAPGRAGPVAAATDALLGFSSGTTGPSKRLARSQANLVAEADNFTASAGMSEADVILGVAPLFHAHGLGNALLAAVRSGATLVLEERFDPRSVLARLREERITAFPGVPFMFRMLAELRSGTRADAAPLRLVFSAGAPLPRAVFEAFHKRYERQVRQLYGCSEAGSVTLNLDDDPAATADTVGQPLRGVRVRILAEDGSSCAPGDTGQIAITSSALTTGYHGDPERNRRDFADGWFRTGDLGHLDAEGRLTVTGRVTLFVSTAAGKVDPGEVEACIALHPRVDEVVVVAVPGRGGDEKVKAVVVVREGSPDASLRRELIARCRERLAEYKIPRLVEFRDAIPRSPVGKILRRELVSPKEG